MMGTVGEKARRLGARSHTRVRLVRTALALLVTSSDGVALGADPGHPLPKPAVHAAEPPKGPASTDAPKAPAKPAETPKVAAKPTDKGDRKESPKVAAPAVRSADMRMRRSIAGGATQADLEAGVESPELRALREAERELFPPASAGGLQSWPAELQLPHGASGRSPHIDLSGLPRGAEWAEPGEDRPASEHAWLDHLVMPEVPVRLTPRVIRYLEFYKDDPRGRSGFAALYKRSGRYRNAMSQVLREKGVPEDLVWVALVESGFDPYARSFAGAVGMWQLMTGTAKIYGLTVDRFLDERMAPERSTEAAVEFLSDMQRRFGNWDLALAGYHMGYGGIASVIRRHNTNDFWTLAEIEGALPWLTTLYVPRILAVAVVARNLDLFGFSDLTTDAPLAFDDVVVPADTSLSAVAKASGAAVKEIEALNPELRAGRTPPATAGAPSSTTVRVPKGRGAAATRSLAKSAHDSPALERYVVRFGETLGQVAAAHGTTSEKLIRTNNLSPSEVVRGGTVLLVPHVDKPIETPKSAEASEGKAPLFVPSDIFVYPERRRVFYRVTVGDALDELAAALGISVEELCRWNTLDPSARLIEGMTLQAFVSKGADLSRIAVEEESEVHAVAIGSDEFFSRAEAHKGLRRIVVSARKGETLEAIGKRFDVPGHIMERVNRRERSTKLAEGDSVVVYVTPNRVATADPPEKRPALVAPVESALPPLRPVKSDN